MIEATMVPKIFVASKGGKSSGITFLPSSLDATVMGDLLEVEKLLGCKPKTKVGEHVLYAVINEGKHFNFSLIF